MGAAWLLISAGTPLHAMAQGMLASEGGGQQVLAEDKADRMRPPALAALESSPVVMDAAPSMPDFAPMSADQRITQAFADIPLLEIALRLNEPPAAAISIAALRPTTTMLDAGDELLTLRPATGRETADPESIFEIALGGKEPTTAREEPLGGGYLAALAPPDDAWEASPAYELDNDTTGAIPPPDFPSGVPTPTPRPEYAPVARLAPQTPAQTQRQAEPEPAPQAETSARAPSAAQPEQPEQEMQPQAQARPSLPPSLMPTRPPAD